MKKNKPQIYFVATVEYAVCAFLLKHLEILSRYYEVSVLVNSDDLFFLKKRDLNINVIPFRIKRHISIFSDLLSLILLIVIFLKNRPVAVHSITPKAGLLAMLAGFLVLIPNRIHTFTGQVWSNKTGVKKFFFKFFDRVISNLTTFNLIDSHSQKKFLIKEKVIMAQKSIVFGSGSVCGVDLKKFKTNKKIREKIRTQLSIPNDAFVFIYLGRFVIDKGILDLASAFSNIRDKRAYLIMVGPDEGDLSKHLKNLAGDNQYKLRLLDYSREPQLYLAAADVLCLPSYREGFGSVIIEAAAMGIPAIASNIYGISDAVLNNKTGLLHPPKDVDAIYTCMEKLLLDPKLVKSYGLSAKKRAVKEFDDKLISQFWLDFYLSNVN